MRDLNSELLRFEMVDAITVFTARIPAEGAAREQLAPGYEVVRYPAFDAIPNSRPPLPGARGRGARRGARCAVVITTSSYVTPASS